MGTVKRVKKVTTIAPMVYTAVQNPKTRGVIINGLDKASVKLNDLNRNHRDPLVGSITGKPVSSRRPNKVDALAAKLPANTFDTLQKAVVKAKEALVKLDGKSAK